MDSFIIIIQLFMKLPFCFLEHYILTFPEIRTCEMTNELRLFLIYIDDLSSTVPYTAEDGTD
jgi:hypothetical protein